MSHCQEEMEEICLCRDCGVSNCERYNCMECEGQDVEKLHEVFFCNSFKEGEYGK